jgi:DNA replication protein DnaC
MAKTNINIRSRLKELLKELRLPAIRESYEELAKDAQQNSLSPEEFLLGLTERECEYRRLRRTERLLRASRLPIEKTMESFDIKRLSTRLIQVVKSLITGEFLDRKENVLAFGNPGSGKTHLLCAVSQELIRNGKSVYFSPCSLLVQELLAGKKDLRLEKVLKRLGKYQAVIIDDIGYVQHNREEMEVLFTFLAERYERGSVMLTSNLPFSKWEAIFKDPMTTAAAIDRLVHHSVILELNLPSYRLEQAKKQTGIVKKRKELG